MLPQACRRLVLVLTSLALLVLPAGATWSIVCVNARTGEVGVASATCLAGFNLKVGTPVVVVGKGAAAAQSLLDVGAVNRKIIWREIRQGVLTPAEILELLEGDALYASRQYGIVTLTGDPLTYTGSRAGAAASGVTGEIDGYVYAIQGNLLTADSVVLMAEVAFRGTDGDMSQRLMAAMEAARALGGDGRCSCSQARPTSCGAPPPDFEKSAHCGYVIVARQGDTNGICNDGKGCANGDYYLASNIANQNAQAGDLDPVLQLQARYDNWRMSHVGRADGVLSTIESVQALPADGVTTRTVTVRLADVDGVPITWGGATVTVSTVSGAPSLVGVGPVEDHDDGTYSFELSAGTTPGLDRLRVHVQDGPIEATLYPYLDIRSDPVDELHVAYDQVSASAGPRVPFVVNAPDRPKAKYMVVASFGGTQPGTTIGSLFVPLNEPIVSVLGNGIGLGAFPRSIGRVGKDGRAEPELHTKNGMLDPVIGAHVDWSVLLFGDGAVTASNPVGFDIVP